MPSAHINFQLRPNKSVERKLIFGALGLLTKAFGLPQYAYIGFGSYWFTDVVMAHKRLSITDLVSIEGDPEIAPRARANVPFARVEVREGRSVDVLPDILKTRDRVVAWLDYDGGADAAVTSDIALLTERLPGGSIVLLTLNAHPGKFGSEREREKRLREVFPEAPTPLPGGFFQRSADRFPANLAALLLDRLARGVSRRIDHQFAPLFNMYYQDGAPMVTTGGIVLRQDQQDTVTRTGVFDAPGVTGANQYVIDAPALTRREKLVLDRLLPRGPNACTKDEICEAGLPSITTDEEAAVYARLLTQYAPVYKDYPVYSEFEL